MHWCPQPLEQHFCSLGQSLSVWQNSAHKPAPHFRRGHLPGFAEGKEEHGNMALICLFFSRNYRLVFYGLYVSVWGQIKFSDKSKILNKKKKHQQLSVSVQTALPVEQPSASSAEAVSKCRYAHSATTRTQTTDQCLSILTCWKHKHGTQLFCTLL